MTLATTVAEKTERLRDLFAQRLTAFDSRFRVETRVREAVLRATSARNLRDVMGNPVRYAEILLMRPESSVPQTTAPVQALAHRYMLRIWYEYRDAARFEDSSEYEWLQLIGDPAAGIVDLIASRYRDDMLYMRTDGVEQMIVPLLSDGTLLAHLLIAELVVW